MAKTRIERPAATLEPFPVSPLLADRIAPVVSRFVEAERSWLQQYYPLVVEHYQWPIRGVQGILNLGQSEQSQAYIVHGRTIMLAATGLARVGLNQEIVHPELEQPITGDRIGYLLRARGTAEEHLAVVAQLIERQGDRPAFAALATGDPQAGHKDTSLREFMIPVGEPAMLRSMAPSDPFESGHLAGPAQLYQFVPS